MRLAYEAVDIFVGIDQVGATMFDRAAAAAPAPFFSWFPRLSLFWRLQLSTWFAVGIVTIPLKKTAYGSYGDAFLISSYYIPIGIGLSCLLRLLYRRVAGWRFLPLAATMFAAVALIAWCDVVLSEFLGQFFGVEGLNEVVTEGLFHIRAAFYLCWSLLYFWLKAVIAAREEAFQASIAEERARLEALRYQLNPHFLFNTLTTICGEIHAQPEAARAMTVRLADFYQRTLRQTDRRTPATVGTELELLRAYLEIEAVRLGDAMRFTFEIEPAAAAAPLPPVLLLPLAENAVKYGAATCASRLEIRLTASRTADGAVVIELANTGRIPTVPPAHVSSTGIGLANLRSRLDRYFPGAHRFSLTEGNGWVRACVELQP